MNRFTRAYLEITNVCNLACAFCPGTQRSPQFIEPDAFRHAALELRPYTDYLYFHLMGEPLLHPELERLLEIAGELGFRVNLTTNGTLLGHAMPVLLRAPALRKVGISLHSFEANRPAEGLDRYLEETFAFVKRATEAGVICELRLWNGGGADAMNDRILTRVRETFGLPDSIPEGAYDLKLRERLHLVTAEQFDWPDIARQDTQEQLFCRGLRDQIGVLVDGTVVPCCLDSEGTIALGNLFGQPLEEILRGRRAQNIYEGFSQRTAVEELCKRCGYARRFGL